MDTQRNIDKYDLIRHPLRPPLRAPRTMRELFLLLGQLDEAEGIKGLFDRVGLDGMGPIDVYRIAHGRAPDGISQAMPRPDYDPRRAVVDALHSVEFRRCALGTFLNAFPELERDIFIHVPKCAGTDLILNVAPRRLSLPAELDFVGSSSDVLATLSRAAIGVQFSDRIFVHGHIRLGDYVSQAGVRLGDRFYSTVRDPVDQMISQVGDVVAQLLRDKEIAEPYSREWLGYLQLDRLPRDPTVEYMKGVWVRALLDKRIAQPNRICMYLGKGDIPSYDVAIQNVVVHDVEIATTSTYAQWLHERWNTISETRHNASIRMLHRREVVRFLLDELRPHIAEDIRFYRVIAWALAKAGRPSIRGSELPALAGAMNLRDLPEILAEGRGQSVSFSGSGEVVPPDMLVVQGRKHVEAYLTPLPDVGSQAPCVEIADLLPFGLDMEQDRLGEGWFAPEKGFAWSKGGDALVKLRCPQHPGDYMLQMVVSPLVGPGKKSQNIGLKVNGLVLGTATIGAIAVLEAEIPWPLIADEDELTVTFTIPDAARACDVRGGEDTRVLGFAFRCIALFTTARRDDAGPSRGGAMRMPSGTTVSTQQCAQETLQEDV